MSSTRNCRRVNWRRSARRLCLAVLATVAVTGAPGHAEAPPPAEPTPPRLVDPFAALAADPAAVHRDFLAAANAERARRRLPALAADAALDRAAREHAAALLAALRAGQPSETVADIASRLQSGIGNPGVMGVNRANAGGSVTYPERARDASQLGSLGLTVLVDAVDVPAAIQAVAGSDADLFAAGFRRVGIGVAVATAEGDGDGDGDGGHPRAVWVAVLRR